MSTIQIVALVAAVVLGALWLMRRGANKGNRR